MTTDLCTKAPLLNSSSSSGPYTYPASTTKSPPATATALAASVSYTLWHRRLGHTSSAILSVLSKQNFIPCSRLDSKAPCICHACQLGKHVRLPFSHSLSKILILSSWCILMFIYRHASHTVFLLLYVDDIILTASSSALLQSLLTLLKQEFSISDLGTLKYILGISVQLTPDGLFLSQGKYLRQVLEKCNMQDANPSSSPIDSKSKLSINDGDPLPDPTLYRSIIGALQYLIFTTPEITFAVQKVCLFMHAPRTSHFQAVKRILRYLKGTLDHGLSSP